MKAEQTQKLVLDTLNELKAIDIVSIDVRGLTTITDTMVICSGRSSRHVKSMAESVVTAAKQSKLSYIKMEGEREGDWVIVDLADVVVHIMLPTMRDFYRLEDLWEPIQKQRALKE